MTGSNVSAEVGSPANLTCSVYSNLTSNKVTYKWKRAGMTVATSAVYQVSSSVGVSDAGVYTCEVNASDTANSPHVLNGTSSVGNTLTVTSKWRYKAFSFASCSLQASLHQGSMQTEMIKEIYLYTENCTYLRLVLKCGSSSKLLASNIAYLPDTITVPV